MDNRHSIELEAQRRANVMGKTYGVWQHTVEGYCIHRPIEASNPSQGFWKLLKHCYPQTTEQGG